MNYTATNKPNEFLTLPVVLKVLEGLSKMTDKKLLKKVEYYTMLAMIPPHFKIPLHLLISLYTKLSIQLHITLSPTITIEDIDKSKPIDYYNYIVRYSVKKNLNLFLDFTLDDYHIHPIILHQKFFNIQFDSKTVSYIDKFIMEFKVNNQKEPHLF
ncbi:hypothetical protein DLAC_10881 [Tieghemostelium lacteum]|uniref:Uncharacterized protein n=1 Tax=Tieghemostelium lacteum TaxID=361077 RepID=A0A151Z2L4_TIELA|nr:hypothetical protein DLAC_10881 [Tieghemostelium lacteum]|eukprot:KYQ88195.1 hypothetical protein DLAC_10881 [Tieghemostelium lacteum]